MGTLYIVATPIGNLEDISERALKTLQKVDLVIAEDTRVVQKLLNNFGIDTPVESYHQHSGDDKKLFILKELMDGKNIALVSDAGTPGISDPGNELIDFLYEQSNVGSSLLRTSVASRSASDILQILPVPGSSAVSAALSVCGFDIVPHIFIGFWPKKKVSKTLELVRNSKLPFVYFDSPYRVIKNLMTIEEALGGDRRVFVGRELTKMHETHYRGTIEDVIDALQKEKYLKGEIVVILE